jgi:FlgN protein
VSIEELNSILWDERGMLDALQFALETEQWVLSSGRTHWLGRSSEQVRSAVDALRRIEVLRATVADAVAVDLGLVPAPSLAAIASRVHEPWRSILVEQRTALLDATEAIDRASAVAIEGLSGLRTALAEDAPSQAEGASR